MALPRKIQGVITAPPSKSLTQRAVAAAMLAGGTTVLRNPSTCADAETALQIAIAMGATVAKFDGEWHITGHFSAPQSLLSSGESALCLRLFAPLAALHEVPVTFALHGTLRNRPTTETVHALRRFGAQADTAGDRLHLQGRLHAACAEIDGSTTSQSLSGLLMALPLLPGDSEIQVDNLVSRAYTAMTIELLQAFGVQVANDHYRTFRIKGRQRYLPQTVVTEGDWSGAAFWLATAAIGGNITIRGLRKDSLQPDRAILQAVQMTGAATTWHGDGAVQVCAGDRKPFCFDATHCPDLFPPLVLLAACCHGHSEITGAQRLVHKESNRAAALQETFGKLGVPITLHGNTLHVQGGQPLHGAAVSTFHDHRIAMAAACAGLFTAGEVLPDDTACVCKSYPAFFNDRQLLTT